MNLTDETVQKLIESINKIDLKLQILCDRLGNLAGAINPSPGTAKE